MKAKEVQVGATYEVKVSGSIVPVRITSESQYGGWDGKNVETGRMVHLKSCRRLRSLIHSSKEAKQASSSSSAATPRRGRAKPENAPNSAPREDVASEAKPDGLLPYPQTAPGAEVPREVLAELAKGPEEPLESHLQHLVNEFVWKHGPQAVWHEGKLAEAGLTRDQVDAPVIAIAVEQYKARIAANLAGSALHWGPPAEKDVDNGIAHVWHTQCGQYQVCRFAGAEPRFAAVSRIAASNAHETVIGNDMKSLRQAFEFVERRHAEQLGKPVESNSETRIEEAAALRLDRRAIIASSQPVAVPDVGIVDSETVTIALGASRMKIEKIHKMLVDLGLAKAETVAEKWDAKRLARYLGNKEKFAELVGKSKKEPAGASAELLDSIAKALADGGKVEIETGKKGKPAKVVKERKASPERNGKAEADFLGARVGSRKAEINAILKAAKKPMTVKEIRDKGGIPGDYKDYLDELHKAKKVAGNHKDGWELVK